MYLTKREKRKRNVILGKILVNKLMDYEVLIFREPKDIRKIRKQFALSLIIMFRSPYKDIVSFCLE